MGTRSTRSAATMYFETSSSITAEPSEETQRIRTRHPPSSNQRCLTASPYYTTLLFFQHSKVGHGSAAFKTSKLLPRLTTAPPPCEHPRVSTGLPSLKPQISKRSYTASPSFKPQRSYTAWPSDIWLGHLIYGFAVYIYPAVRRH